MPPSFARSSVGGLQAALSACRISTTTTATTTTRSAIASKSSTYASLSWRTFSTTSSAAQSFAIPPESPKFITLPDPPQSSEPQLPPLKGHLPVPRDMFPKREGNRKVRPAYVEATRPISKAELAGKPPRSEEEARHRLMAAARRSALASGLQGLYVRKRQREKKARARSEVRRQNNLTAATAPERLDEVLTRPTVSAGTALKTTVVPHPDRFAAAEAARAQHQQRLALKAEARRDALAQLYVAAQDFIVDEAELEARVNKIFTADYHKYGGNGHSQSVWDTQGAPISVTELRSAAQGSLSNLLDSKRGPALKTTERQKLVAEELTGGKL